MNGERIGELNLFRPQERIFVRMEDWKCGLSEDIKVARVWAMYGGSERTQLRRKWVCIMEK